MRIRLLAILIAGAAGFTACGESQQPETAEGVAAAEPVEPAAAETPPPPAFAAVDAERLEKAEDEPGQWMSYGRTYYEQRWSPLDQINAENIGELGLAWFADYDTNQPQESTPLFIDGVIYVTTAWSKVKAYDARTGQPIWQYDPKVPGEWNVNVCCGLDNRGAAAWNGKIIFGTLDGRLIALDAETGDEAWIVEATPRGEPYSITGPPRIAKGVVYIGEAGGEYSIRGYLDAYDAETGEHLWRWWTVPGEPEHGFENEAMEMAAATWKTPGWWEIGGGGPVWDSIVYDPTTDLVYFGVGNGTPWSAVDRDPGGGDNLFLSSVVALHADDGSYVWHYQLNPWETWDYDANQPLMIADLAIDGEQRHVIMQAPKNGFFYVWDAATGELISAEPYTNVNWATGIDMETDRPIEVPEARYDVTEEPWNMLPGPAGAHVWHPMAFSPDTGLVYIPVQEMPFPLITDPDYEPTTSGQNLGVEFPLPLEYYEEHPEEPRGFTGHLLAYDPVNQREVWRSATRTSSIIGPPAPPTGGALATAGDLVFQGVGPEQRLIAFRAETGEELWSADVQTGVTAAPISYELDGEQYIAISVGGDVPGGYYAPNHSRLLVYKLGGAAVLPEPAPFEQRPFDPPEQFASADVIDHGGDVFGARCAVCHGQGGGARSTFPDLRRSPALHDQSLFDAIVLDGALSANGMASFAETLDAADTEGLRAYLVERTHAALEAGPLGDGQPLARMDEDVAATAGKAEDVGRADPKREEDP